MTLAAIRGAGTNLDLISPFTDPWEKLVGEMFLIHREVRGRLPTEHADLLIGGPSNGAANTVEAIRSWAEKVRPKRVGPEDLPPPSHN